MSKLIEMNTACQLNYVISVAYGIVEYKKYLENVENKWYNTVKVFVYGVTDMNKEKYLVLIDGKDKTEEIEKLEQTEKYYIIRFYNANKTYKYNYSKVVIENTTQQIEVKDNQILMIDNIIISNERANKRNEEEKTRKNKNKREKEEKDKV